MLRRIGNKEVTTGNEVGNGLFGLSFAHDAGEDRQPGAEPDGGPVRVRGGGAGGGADALLPVAAARGGPGREGRRDEESGRAACPLAGARPRRRGQGGELARGRRGVDERRRRGVCRRAGDGGGGYHDAAGAGGAGRGERGACGGGARADRACVRAVAGGAASGPASGVCPDLARSV